MWYVCSDNGILAECETFEEANQIFNDLLSFGEEDVWITCD